MEPVRTGFSTYIFEGDGVTNVFPLQFTLGELKRSYVTCQVADEVDGLGNPVYRELIEVPGDPSMIQISGTVPAVGDKIEFKRVVPKDLLLHLYANGSILDYPSLDESHLQLMMAMHEVLDGIGLKNVYTDINMHGYKLVDVFSDPDDPDSIATVAFLGTYRQDALDAAVAAANSAIEALGYRNAAQHSAIEAAGYRNTALYHASTAAAQVVLCQDQVQLAADQVQLAVNQVLVAEGHADDAEQSALDALAAVNSAAFNNMPIGSLVFVTGNNPANGTVAAQGQLLSRTAYPDLWAYAQASGNLSADDASWTKGQYSPGDGSTTFRVPNLQDQFIRGASGTRAVGNGEEDMFKSHTHDTYASDSAAWGGLMRAGNEDRLVYPGQATAPTGGTETRPKNVAYLICIKAYDVISDPNVLNAVEVVNDINRLESEKLRKDENINLGVSVAASGTAVDFVGIPAGVKRITVRLVDISLNGSSNLAVQIGNTGGFVVSGYSSASGQHASSTPVAIQVSNGFGVSIGSAANRITGIMELVRSGNIWVCRGNGGFINAASIWTSGGHVTLSGELDRIRIATVNGTDQFDAGTINVSWEF